MWEKLVKQNGHICKVTENENNHKLDIIQDIVIVFSQQERRNIVG